MVLFFSQKKCHRLKKAVKIQFKKSNKRKTDNQESERRECSKTQENKNKNGNLFCGKKKRERTTMQKHINMENKGTKR